MKKQKAVGAQFPAMHKIELPKSIAVDDATGVYFRLASGAVINARIEDDRIILTALGRGNLVSGVNSAPGYLTVINFRTNQELENMLATGKFGERTLTDEDMQRAKRELNERAKEWQDLKKSSE